MHVRRAEPPQPTPSRVPPRALSGLNVRQRAPRFRLRTRPLTPGRAAHMLDHGTAINCNERTSVSGVYVATVQLAYRQPPRWARPWVCRRSLDVALIEGEGAGGAVDVDGYV